MTVTKIVGMNVFRKPSGDARRQRTYQTVLYGSENDIRFLGQLPSESEM